MSTEQKMVNWIAKHRVDFIDILKLKKSERIYGRRSKIFFDR